MANGAHDNRTQQKKKLSPVPWQMHLLIAVVGLVIIGIAAYGSYTGDYMNRVNAPLVDAAMEIKLENITARLLMEEILRGDRSKNIKEAWGHFNECEWYVRAMLRGGKNPEGTFVAVKDEKIRRMISALEDKLAVLREITRQKVSAKKEPEENRNIDQQYDALFWDFIAHADQIERGMQKVMARDLKRFRLTQGALIVFCLAMQGALWMLFHRFDRLRAKHLLTLYDTNWHLEREIRQRKNVEKALREERDKAQRYLDIAGVILVAVNTDLQVTMLNRKGCEVFECRTDEVIGKDWIENFVPPERRSEIREAIQKTLRGEMEPLEYVENPIITRKGNYRLFGWHTALLKDEEGNTTGLLGSGEEITERKRAEDELRAKEENNRTIFNSANDAIFVHEWETGNIVDANTKVTELYGYTVEEVRGLEIPDISSSRDPFVQEDGLRYIEEVRKGQPQLFEWMAKDKAGNEFWVEVNLKKAVIGGNNRVLAVVRDIRKRKRAEEDLQKAYEELERRVQKRTEQLAKANEELQAEIATRKKMERALVQREKLKTLGAIAAEVAHEIRNPLVSIGGFSRRLQREYPDSRECDIILQESHRLEKILDRIRDYLSPAELRFQECSVNTVIKNCMELLGPEIEGKGVVSELDLDPSLPTVATDSEILTEVVINLIRNAVGAMAEGEHLGISSSQSAEDVLISFRNRMPSSKPIDSELLFLPFDQGGQSIGMPFCYKVLREMGGFISFEQKEDVVVFTVSLPKEPSVTPESR